MGERILTAFEHRPLAIGSGPDALSDADVGALLRLGEQRPGFCAMGHRHVKLAQYAGLVRLDGRLLEILPKIGEHADPSRSRGALLRMLSLARRLPVAVVGAAAHRLERRSLLEVFIAAFLDELALLARRGLVHRYRSREEDLTLVRGRLVFARQATTLAMRPDRIACVYDELTPDNAWNRLLKAALLASRGWIRELDTARHWLALATAFDDVSPRPAAEVLAHALVPDRQVQHYDAAVGWAQWILRLLSPNLRAGEAEAPALLFDNNRLFEQAVAARLAARARERGLRLEAQHTGLRLASVGDDPSAGAFPLRPDLVLVGDGVIAVGDTKWAGIEADGRGRLVPSEAHIYQLNAYASVYPCDELALIYPFDESVAERAASTYRLPPRGARSPRVHVLRVDVSRDGLPLVGPPRESMLASLLA
jgi:5-methylcytosine-specific restriction enzyme subunit McrC